jgi:hypothetical protein
MNIQTGRANALASAAAGPTTTSPRTPGAGGIGRTSGVAAMMTNQYGPRTSILTLTYSIGEQLRSSMDLFHEFSTAADVFDALGLLREGVRVPRSRFKIEGLDGVRFNAICDWLWRCGYDVEHLRLGGR